MSTPKSRTTFSTWRPLPLRILTPLLAFSAGTVMAADNPGAHEHGHAVLQMAVEDNRIDLMLSSPAYNLAGFEHEARNDEEKNRLKEIGQWLETNPLVDTASPSCRMTAASVQLGEEMDDHHDEHQGEKAHHDHHDEHHAHKDDHREATHREYEVSQQLECEGMGSSQEFTSALMERFEELEELTIEWVTPSGQGSARLTPSNREFTTQN